MACGEKGLSMRKIALSLGFAAIFVGLGRFLFAPAFLAERSDGATRILLAAGLHRDRRCRAQMSRRARQVGIFLWRRVDKLI
jgi:hypothetical protein